MFDKNALPNGWYVVEFDNPGSPRGVGRTIIQCLNGFCHTMNDAVLEDGPIPMAETVYRVIKNVDFWAA